MAGQMPAGFVPDGFVPDEGAQRTATPLPAGATRGMLPNSTATNRDIPALIEEADLMAESPGMPNVFKAGQAARAVPGIVAKGAQTVKAVPGVIARGLGISKERAGQNIQGALEAAKDARVGMDAAQPIIARSKELAATGHNRSQVIHKLEMAIKKAQDGTLTPQEAQDFVSSASRMSSAEGSRISPAMHRQVSELAAVLRKALADTVETAAGKGKQYMDGVNEYRRAAKAGKFAEKAGKAAIYGSGAGAYYQLFGD